MIDLGRATRVEVLKLRRTLAFAVAIIVPLVVIGMTTVLLLARDAGPRGSNPSALWNSIMLNFVMFIWCLVALGPLVALETALLAGVEHRENAWKHLFCLPVSRWSIYVAKLIVAVLLLILSAVVLDLGFAAEGALLVILRPDLGLTFPIPWATLATRTADFTVASAFILAIQSWVATRWRSFPLAAGLGIAGSVAGLVLGISPRSAGVASFFPWSLPFLALPRPTGAIDPSVPLTAILVGLLGGLVVAALGCWDVIRQDVA